MLPAALPATRNLPTQLSPLKTSTDSWSALNVLICMANAFKDEATVDTAKPYTPWTKAVWFPQSMSAVYSSSEAKSIWRTTCLKKPWSFKGLKNIQRAWNSSSWGPIPPLALGLLSQGGLACSYFGHRHHWVRLEEHAQGSKHDGSMCKRTGLRGSELGLARSLAKRIPKMLSEPTRMA